MAYVSSTAIRVIETVYSILTISHFILSLHSLFFPPVSPSISFHPSRGAPVYAGTEFVVTAHISFSGPSVVTVPCMEGIRWGTVDGNVLNSSRTAVSPVSGDGGSYTASLTFQPITTVDAGQYTATVTFNPPADSMYIVGGSATAKYTITVDGMRVVSAYVPYTCSAADCMMHCMGYWSNMSTHKLEAVHTCIDRLCPPLPSSSPPCRSASDTPLPCLCHSRRGCGAELFSASGGASGAVSHTGLEWRQCG